MKPCGSWFGVVFFSDLFSVLQNFYPEFYGVFAGFIFVAFVAWIIPSRPPLFSLSMSKNNSVLLLLTWCSRELAEVKVVPDSGLEANVNETGGGGTEDAPSGISTSKTSMFISQSEKSESVLKKKKKKKKSSCLCYPCGICCL